MGNLLRVLNDKGPVPKIDFFVDFESKLELTPCWDLVGKLVVLTALLFRYSCGQPIFRGCEVKSLFNLHR